MKKLRTFLVLIFILVVLAGIALYWAYQQVYQPNVQLDRPEASLYIQTDTDYKQLRDILVDSQFVKNAASFDRVAGWMKFTTAAIKPGHYVVKDQWSNRKLISVLRSGSQTPVKLILHDERSLEQIAGAAASYLAPDSLEMLKQLQDPRLYDTLGIPQSAALSLFLPNTYEFYWTTSPSGFVKRMIREYKRFWTEKRNAQAQAMDLEKYEVYILASIVERETKQPSEKSRIAGVYLNRLEKGILLQADPTVVFASGDFSLKRVLNKHLAIDSPYNTYIYAGLPPGPICMPSLQTIDAVLQAEDHDYLYFCARADKPGYHAFAKTLTEHNANARKYRAWLSQQGIR